jgi:hypothetical protein
VLQNIVGAAWECRFDPNRKKRFPIIIFPDQRRVFKVENDNAESTNNAASSIPSISLPKGGGAIRGIGEKFAANPVTGTGSLSVPIATSPGRSGFGPQLSLS